MAHKRKATRLPTPGGTVEAQDMDEDKRNQEQEKKPALVDNGPYSIPNDVIPMVAGLAMDGETFEQLVAIGEETAEVIQLAQRADVSLLAPWKCNLGKPIVLYNTKTHKKTDIVPTMFSQNGKHLVGEIRNPYHPDECFGIVVWSQAKDCAYVMYSVATMGRINKIGRRSDLDRQYHPIREGSHSFQHVHDDVPRELNRGIILTAYAMPSDGHEVVISDTCGGLIRLSLSLIDDDSQYGAIHYIEHGGDDPPSNDNSVDCMVFTKSGDSLITGHKTRGEIKIRSRNMNYRVTSVIQRVMEWGDLASIAVAGDDLTLAIATHLGFIELWNLGSLTMTKRMKVGGGNYHVLSNLHFSPNGESLIAATRVPSTRPNPRIRHQAHRNAKDLMWNYHIPSGRQLFTGLGRLRRTLFGDYPSVFRAGFYDNQACWAVAGTTLSEWKVSEDGMPEQGEDHYYPTFHNFAISEDRSMVAYNNFTDVVTVEKFMDTLFYLPDDPDDINPGHPPLFA